MKIIIIPVGQTGYLQGSASERFRCYWLAPPLGADVYDRTQNFDDYDVIIHQKTYVSKEFVALSKKYKNKTQILDITDMPIEFRDQFEQMAENCKMITTSSLDLADSMKIFNPCTYCIPDRHNLSFYKVSKQHVNRTPQLVWFGYFDNFKRIEPLLNYIEKRFILWTICDKPTGHGRFIKWTLENSNNDIIRGDIVLNPLAPFKSNNKTTTAWALGMPVATTESEIERFIDVNERMKESKFRLAEVREKWDIKISAEEIKQLIRRR